MEKLVDAEGIRVYLGDVLWDDFGEPWVLLFDDPDVEEYKDQFYLKFINTDKNTLLFRLPAKDVIGMNFIRKNCHGS